MTIRQADSRAYFDGLDAIQQHAEHVGVRWTWLPFKPYNLLAVQFPGGETVVMTRDKFVHSSKVELWREYGAEPVTDSPPPAIYLSLPRLPGVLSRVRGLLRRT